MGPRFESVKAHHTVYPQAHRLWPVGQVVKTAASHAVNIGSNPVRVTTQKQASDRSLPAKAESSFPSLLFRSSFQICGLKAGKEKQRRAEVPLDKEQYRRYNFIVILVEG